MSTRRRFLRRAGIVVIGAPFLGALRAAGAEYPMVKVDRYGMTMGAIAGIRLYGPDRRFCEEAAAAALAEMRRVDALMSAFDPASALSRLNAAAGRGEVSVRREITDVLLAARAFHGSTGGAFDVTVGPLLDLYGFHRTGAPAREAGPGGPPGRCPDDRTIASALSAVGFGSVTIDSRRGTAGLIHPASRIDLGGIGVGYALDRAASALRARGVESALINHSGDIIAVGAPPGREGWEIGIQDPADPRGTIASFALRDRSVSTSGNYENYIETDRGRIGHILDPVTGRSPARFLSVSVMAGSSLAADALSTGFFAGMAGLRTPAPEGSGKVSAFLVRAPDDPRSGSLVTEFLPQVSCEPR